MHIAAVVALLVTVLTSLGILAVTIVSYLKKQPARQLKISSNLNGFSLGRRLPRFPCQINRDSGKVDVPVFLDVVTQSREELAPGQVLQPVSYTPLSEKVENSGGPVAARESSTAILSVSSQWTDGFSVSWAIPDDTQWLGSEIFQADTGTVLCKTDEAYCDIVFMGHRPGQQISFQHRFCRIDKFQKKECGPSTDLVITRLIQIEDGYSGSCASWRDAKYLITAHGYSAAKFVQVVIDCTVASSFTWTKAPKIRDCVIEKTKQNHLKPVSDKRIPEMSKNCAWCMGQMGACVFSNCLIACIKPDSTCKECILRKCTAALKVCAGPNVQSVDEVLIPMLAEYFS